MRSWLSGLLLLAWQVQATPQLVIDRQLIDGYHQLRGAVSGISDGTYHYHLSVHKQSGANRVHSAQAGPLILTAGQPAYTGQIRMNITPGDQYQVHFQVFDRGQRPVAECWLRFP